MPTLSSILGSNFPGAQGETGPTGPTGPQGPAGSDAASYTNADVDTHLNYSTATTGQVLSFSGSDYDWVDVAPIASPTFTGTVTATAFAGDGSALTGVGGSTTVGAVGTYAMLSASSSLAKRDAGETVSGSSLRWANAYSNNNATPNGASSIVGYGTWRLMGNTGYENNGAYTTSYQRNQTSLWLRIS